MPTVIRLLAWVGLLLIGSSLAWAQQLINGSRVITGTLNAATTTGTATAYVLTLNPAISAYVDKQCFTFKAHVTNTGAATLNINTVGAAVLKKYAGGALSDLAAGDITSGQIISTCYDGSAMQLVGAGGAGGGGGGLGFTPENVANKSTTTTLGTSSTLYPTQGAVKSYVDTGLGTKQDQVAWGAGLTIAAGTASVASTEPGFLTDGGSTNLACGAGQAGKMQVMDNGEAQYCDGAATPLLWSGVPTQAGLRWNASGCSGLTNGGKLTIVGTSIECAADLGAGGGGGGDAFTNTSTSVDNELALFSGSGGKTLKRATTTGILKGTAGVLSAATGVTDDAQLKRAANDFTPFPTKATPDAADVLLIEDSAASGAKKKVTVSSLPTGTGTVADNSITLAKMADMAPDFLIGRFSGGSGDPEYLSDTQVKTILDLSNVDNTSDATKNAANVTMTNHLVVPRSATPTVTANAFTPDLDQGDVFVLTTIAADLTINDPIGTGGKPYPEQEISFRFKSSTPRALTWGLAFSNENGIPLPTNTTGDGTITDRFKFIRNADSGKYGMVASTMGVQRGLTTLASSTTFTCNAQIAAQCRMQMTGAAGTITMAAPTGATPVDGTKLKLDLMCTNLQTLAWNAIFIASPNIVLPTTGACPAGVSMWIMFGFEYSTLLSKYQLIATN